MCSFARDTSGLSSTVSSSYAAAAPASAATKGHHHRDAVQVLAPLLTGDQPVVFAVNGIPWWYGINVRLPGVDPTHDPARRTMDPGGEIGRIVGNRAVGAVIGSPNTVEAPGIVVNRTERNALVLGAVDSTFAPMLAPLAAVLRDAGHRSGHWGADPLGDLAQTHVRHVHGSDRLPHRIAQWRDSHRSQSHRHS
jgi:hypothetical protein